MKFELFSLAVSMRVPYIGVAFFGVAILAVASTIRRQGVHLADVYVSVGLLATGVVYS